MRKRRFVFIVASLLVVVALCFSLAGCLKIRMRERNLETRLQNAGADISHERTAPMLADGTTQQKSGIGTIIFAFMGVTEYNAELQEDVEHQEMLYILFAKSDEAGDWAEESAKAWLKTQQDLRAEGQEDPNGDVAAEWDLAKWNVYRFDDVVMCGHYKVLSVARGY